jgi:hypothetical protein
MWLLVTSISRSALYVCRLVRRVSKGNHQLRHVCPPVCPHGIILLPLEGFSWNLIFENFSKICEGNITWSKFDNNRYFPWRPLYSHIFDHISFTSSYNEKCFKQKVAEKIKTHFMFSNFIFENRAVYEIMWQNTVEPGRPQMTIWRMSNACWILRLQAHTQKM